MGEVNPSCILSEEHRPKHVITEGEGIPLIDLSPITNREGLSADPNKAVEDLLLRECNALEGDIVHAGFFNMSSLIVLALYENDLIGNLPDNIFEYNKNNLTGSIPKNIGNLTQLTEIHLVINNLIGEIPDEIGDPHNLQGLALHVNNLNGVIPSRIFNLSMISI
ncbi:hypothetical protein L3X38_008214 [Prunus dulcis]|uniref:L domain-like protein n=1 Tax=Prunus dulcis TaxID=3755 RepID=A0AAD4ZW53_PRUDU|nr:hypothetical protein L3X38_008214 [Prunus dulcis]